MQKPHPKSNGKVTAIPPDLYARWRAHTSAVPALREAEEDAPSERLLQRIWEHQRLRRDQLKTFDGQTVRILHPGFWNHEAGPDFRGAVLRFPGEPPRTGDVEIDLHPAGWRGHGHDRNPAYRNVVLHVVWHADSPAACSLPTLALKSRLDSPLSELRLWLTEESDAPGLLAGKCSAPLRSLPADILRQVLHQAALIRLRRKASEFAARARQVGWEQSLWEGLFAALGYKHNLWPMRRVAELLPLLLARDLKKRSATFALQARLLGVSGLLPTELTRARASTDQYLRRVWDHWWREREEFADVILPRGLWRFNGLRPANHPQRRLALAAHWLAAGSLPDKLEKWFTARIPDRKLEPSLLEILQAGRDDFWLWHWTFRSARMTKAQPLLGAGRVTDVAVNVVLPWFWMRAVAGNSDDLQRAAERRYFAWPKSQDNAVLRLARQRLLGGADSRALHTAAMQQGLLQIVRDFCEHSNALCENCRFPELVRSLSAAGAPGAR
ncbi:MAG TPA: DUF2851 family protein [Haliangiales bacterium]|nr:DUF2851 family protein [Haliangiales bacterium]